MARDQSEEDVITEVNNKKKSRTLTLVFLVIIALYLIVTVIFSFIALPNTKVNGRDISFASKDEALKKPAEPFTIEIVGRDERKASLDLKDFDYSASIPESASIDQNPFKWPLAFANIASDDFHFDYNVKYDEEKLEKNLKGQALLAKVKEPENARLKYENGAFKIIPEVMGNKIDFGKLSKKIKDAIYSHKEEVVLKDDDYINPTVKNNSKELAALLEDGKTIEKMKIGFNFNGFDIKLEGEKFMEMFDTDKGSFELNYDKLTKFVDEVADKTDTYGKKRTFNATGIGKITVNPGVYGFVLDVPATVDEIYQLVNTRKSGDIEPVYERTGFRREADGSDLGSTYIEVDLSRQYMWYYQDGQVVLETPIVSGLPNTTKWATNVGVGSILEKASNKTLRGDGFDGSRYETPVKYWMPIGWDGEGLHDAPWRGAFGGAIYFSNGSHGCLNMPPAMAKKLFDLAPHGTPVVVYESSTHYSPAMSY